MILQAIAESEKMIKDADIPALQEEFISFIDDYIAQSPGRVWLTNETDDPGTTATEINPTPENRRYVIIGDLHCDLDALKGIMLKLSVEGYDYFNKAVFIFMGDYLDRGFKPYQTLRLLFRLKQILGPRCIFLKGNHDGFYFDRAREIFYPSVYPANTIERMFHDFEPATMEKFKMFFDHLPYFVLARVKEKRYFITHGGIPRDCYMDQVTPARLEKLRLPFSSSRSRQSKVYKALESLTWGDPVDTGFISYQGDVRFEFGLVQFERFRQSFGFTHLIRGHEPQKTGFQSCFYDQVYTIFSTGGKTNKTSYYANIVPEPAFGIIDEEGTLRAESIFN